jgi:two-component system NarL family response regulator
VAATALKTTPRALFPIPGGAVPARVVVIDEQPVTRIGLMAVLNAERDLVVVGDAGDVPRALAMIEQWSPDAVLIDPQLGGADGPEAIRALLRRSPRARVVAVSQRDGDEEIHKILAAGACGYVLKSAPPAEIVAALRDARAGRTCLSAGAQHRLDERRRLPALTPRERQVLALMAEAHCNATIAAVLEIAPGTVKLHVKAILAKLGVEDRAQALVVALRRGFARIA